MLAARSINSALAEMVDEDAAFHEFEQRYRREFGVFYEFLVAFYDLNVNEDSYFWSAKKVTKNTNRAGVVRRAGRRGLLRRG